MHDTISVAHSTIEVFDRKCVASSLGLIRCTSAAHPQSPFSVDLFKKGIFL